MKTLTDLARAIYAKEPMTKNGKPIPWDDLKPWDVARFMGYATAAFNFRVNGEEQGN
jgi:hypothetical protein